jgi:hypothetical protein
MCWLLTAFLSKSMQSKCCVVLSSVYPLPLHLCLSDRPCLSVFSRVRSDVKSLAMPNVSHCSYCGGPQDLHADYCMFFKKKTKAKDETSSEDAALMQGIVDDANVRVRLSRLVLSPSSLCACSLSVCCSLV